MAGKNSNSNLEQALTALIQSQATLTHSQATLTQNQAILTQNQAAFVAQMNEWNKLWNKQQVESERRFERIEADLEQIKAILREHHKMLEALPDVIRQKIGFKAK